MLPTAMSSNSLAMMAIVSAVGGMNLAMNDEMALTKTSTGVAALAALAGAVVGGIDANNNGKK
jgi:hypothetical protein